MDRIQHEISMDQISDTSTDDKVILDYTLSKSSYLCFFPKTITKILWSLL